MIITVIIVYIAGQVLLLAVSISSDRVTRLKIQNGASMYRSIPYHTIPYHAHLGIYIMLTAALMFNQPSLLPCYVKLSHVLFSIVFLNVL